MYPNTYNLSIWFSKGITSKSLSHNMFDYKWNSKVWVNEMNTRILKLNESCMLNNMLNENGWNRCCLNLIELIYSWSWKIVVIDFLLEVRSPLTISRTAVLTWANDRWTKFQIVRSSFATVTAIANYFSKIIDLA